MLEGLTLNLSKILVCCWNLKSKRPNGLRYLRWGGRGFCLVAGKDSKPSFAKCLVPWGLIRCPGMGLGIALGGIGLLYMGT